MQPFHIATGLEMAGVSQQCRAVPKSLGSTQSDGMPKGAVDHQEALRGSGVVLRSAGAMKWVFMELCSWVHPWMRWMEYWWWARQDRPWVLKEFLKFRHFFIPRVYSLQDCVATPKVSPVPQFQNVELDPGALGCSTPSRSLPCAPPGHKAPL